MPYSNKRERFNTPLLGALGLLAVGMFALTWMRDAGNAGGGNMLLAADLPNGGRAPAFTATTLAGETLRFPDDFRGQVVLLDFWATWCPPCRAKFPHLVKVREQFADEPFQIVGVSLDESRGISAASVERFMDSANASWPTLYQNIEQIAADYRVRAIPHLVLVDADTGQILALGDALRGDGLERTLERVFARRNAS